MATKEYVNKCKKVLGIETDSYTKEDVKSAYDEKSKYIGSVTPKVLEDSKECLMNLLKGKDVIEEEKIDSEEIEEEIEQIEEYVLPTEEEVLEHNKKIVKEKFPSNHSKQVLVASIRNFDLEEEISKKGELSALIDYYTMLNLYDAIRAIGPYRDSSIKSKRK